MNPQPLIAVHDVPASSHWYQAVLGCESGHGGSEYERIMCQGRMVLQIHLWDAHDHPHLGSHDLKPYGNGVILWFQTDDFDEAIRRINVLHPKVLEEPKVNLSANHREVWLRDLDGYVVVIAGRDGDLGVP
jgi:extradiol dioxygenase family protein